MMVEAIILRKYYVHEGIPVYKDVHIMDSIQTVLENYEFYCSNRPSPPDRLQ